MVKEMTDEVVYDEDGIGPCHVITIPPETWINMPDNPKQRNTEAHAKRVLKGSLKVPKGMHSYVEAAQLPDVSYFKVDGHTRAYIWRNGIHPTPTQIKMRVYQVRDAKSACNLYNYFDNIDSSKTAIDKLSGALRRAGIVPKASLISTTGAPSALVILEAGKSYKLPTYSGLDEVVVLWKKELIAIDDREYSRNKKRSVSAGGKRLVTAPILAAMLATYRVYGEECFLFWNRYYEEKGLKTLEGMDGVFALDQLMSNISGANIGGLNNRVGITQRALYLFEVDRKKLVRPLFKSVGLDIPAYLHPKGPRFINADHRTIVREIQEKTRKSRVKKMKVTDVLA